MNNDEIRFDISGINKNGESVYLSFSSINKALRTLWRMKATEIFLGITIRDSRTILFVKLGKRRAILLPTCKQIPINENPIKKLSKNWSQLPCKWNNLS